MAREQRKLAAIVAADVVGYSRLMGRDESGTLARLRKNRSEHLDPVLTKYGGRLVKLTGDGALIEFASAVDALSAAIEFQQAMAEANGDQPADAALVFRMGLHLGDLIVDGDDLYGDGINVAARLEGDAPAGGILISGNVRDAVAGRLKATFEDLGGLSLRNIERPVQAFSVRWEPSDWQLSMTSEVAIAPATASQTPLPLPDKPSIAVLPFQNLSGDPEQEYFADGMVEDIITALSRFKTLFVIARNSSFTYKGKAIDIKQVGQELGVRYVLEGSVRRAINRVRISGQLIDTTTGGHLWADHYDGLLEDVFDLQDRVTTSVVGAMVPKLDLAEMERAKRKPAANLRSYECYLRGLAIYYSASVENIGEAMRLFTQALELDPQNSTALGMLLGCHAHRRSFGLVDDAEREKVQVEELIRIAVRCDDANAVAHAAYAIGTILRDLHFAEEQSKRALALNPNLAEAWSISGWVNYLSGNPALAVEHALHALRLDPLFVNAYRRSSLAHAYFFSNRYREAFRWAEKHLRDAPDTHVALRIGAASAAFAGMAEVAEQLGARLTRVDPAFRVSRLEDYIGPYRLPDYVEKLKQGLRLAGLPE